MARIGCPHHGPEQNCSCAMGHLYRFIEPVVLLMLDERGSAYGYELSENLESYALTDARIERAALYRALRTLEANGHVHSSWATEAAGPARHVYSLTDSGRAHLDEWAQLLARMAESMQSFVTRHADNRKAQKG